jgi:hypothetical protein
MTRLRAAAGAVSLEPVVGSRLSGFAVRLEPSTGIHDPLRAKLLLLDDGDARLLSIACDLIGWSPADADELRRMVAQRISAPPAHVLVCCTHTHSGPCSMEFRGPWRQVDDAWRERAFAAIAREAGAIVSRLRSARLAHACEKVNGVGYNRQDGVSPIDQGLLVAQVRGGDDDRVIATILNYATHPVVLGDRNLLFSADYPGYACRLVEEAAGGISLFVQGAAGDVNPFIFRDHPREQGTFEVAESMGRTLAAAAMRVIERAPFASDVRLAIAGQDIQLPLDPPPSASELSKLKSDLLARRGPSQEIPTGAEARWAMFELAWVQELEQAMAGNAVPRSLMAQLSAARIGELSIVTFPLEVYSQIGLEIRRQLEPRPVIIAGYTNGLFGYAPTDAAIDQGGYGPATSHRFFPHLLTPLARGTEQRLIRAATILLRSLDPDHRL